MCEEDLMPGNLRKYVPVARASARIVLAGAVSVALLQPLPAQAQHPPTPTEYRLSPGDTLELSIAGAPELSQRSSVDLSGEIAFPLLGTLRVAGLSLSEVRAQVESVIPVKMLRRKAPEGRESVFAIGPDEVLITIVEYRPVYINGDVSKPGEQVYRPFMTVRQAIAVAGGYDILRFRMNNPYLESAELRSQHEVLWTEFAQTQARISRLEAEMNGKTEMDTAKISENPTSPQIVSQIVQFEADLLKTREADFGKEKAYLGTAIKQAGARLSFLTEQQTKEAEGVKFDTADLERVSGLYDKGQGTILRVTDARRSLLLSSTRQLQTFAQATQVELQRDELGRKLQKIDDARRIAVVDELQDAVVRLSTLRFRLQEVSEKILYVSSVRSELVRGMGSQREIIVFRRGTREADRISANEDTELMPGDVVQVTLSAPIPPGQ